MAATLWYCDVLGQCNHVAITGLCFIDKHPGQTGRLCTPSLQPLQGHFHPLHGRRAGRREYVLYSLLLRDTPSVLGVVECGAVTQSR